MDGDQGRDLSIGVNQSGVRDHNERLVLTMIQRDGAMPGIEVARRTGLSPQTASNILRKLETDGLLLRGDPVRGKVGKPSVPMRLNPDGVFAFGLKIGRRSADLLLLDFAGQVRGQLKKSYPYPMPEAIFGFLDRGMAELTDRLPPEHRARLCGIGIATPFELWKWSDMIGVAADRFKAWKDVDFIAEVARLTDLRTHVINDGTAACHAEQLYGRGKEFRDYAYFFIGSFVGGGVALNGSVFPGNQGNAGALGSMRSTGPSGESQQLVDVASLHLLEARLIEAGIAGDILWREPQDWGAISRYVEPWIGETAQELAKASLSVCSVIDFQSILIDGAFPADVRAELVERVRRYLIHQDKRGLIAPRIEAGGVGGNARAIGAASVPIIAQFLLSTGFGLSHT